MRVFIFSAAAGGGHIRTAQALEQYINHHVVDAKVKVVDALKEVNYIYDKLICKGYHFVPAGFSGAEHALLHFSGYGWNRAA